jgi:hypothetical protein
VSGDQCAGGTTACGLRCSPGRVGSGLGASVGRVARVRCVGRARSVRVVACACVTACPCGGAVVCGWDGGRRVSAGKRVVLRVVTPLPLSRRGKVTGSPCLHTERGIDTHVLRLQLYPAWTAGCCGCDRGRVGSNLLSCLPYTDSEAVSASEFVRDGKGEVVTRSIKGRGGPWGGVQLMFARRQRRLP